MIRKREQEVEFHLKAHEPTISNGASECFLAASLFLGQSRNFMNIFKFVANDFAPNFPKKKKKRKSPRFMEATVVYRRGKEITCKVVKM